MLAVELPEMEKGSWKIEKFSVDAFDFSSMRYGRTPKVGAHHTRLIHNGRLIMSDTLAEQRDHIAAVHRARGKCLVNGLGLGMVLRNILVKLEVDEVTVVEISQDLIDLVSPHYQDRRVRWVCDDAFSYKPPTGKRYNMVWHDIWPELCIDNLAEMARLHRKYGRICDWQGSWGKELLLHRREQERRRYW